MSRSTPSTGPSLLAPNRISSRLTRSVPHWALGVLAAALLLPLGAAADGKVETLRYDIPGPVPSLSPDYRLREEHPVVITDQGLFPASVVMKQGEGISWRSATSSPSRIVFEREVAKSMICHSLVNFSLTEDELRSADLFAGDTASFCDLAPGRYRYRVIRTGHGELYGMNGARRLEGWIVVNPSPLAAAGR